MLLIFGLVRCIAKPSLIKVSRVSLHCSDMLNSKFSKSQLIDQATGNKRQSSDTGGESCQEHHQHTI